jgi:hypothetical protein
MEITTKKFDLNIEQILENWETYHAIREIIANALDEQILTDTSEVEIFKRDEDWFIRDYGRGLKYTHLTQNENEEKLLNDNVIGRFGIGLKDALATFERKGIKVKITSKYNKISTAKSEKQGFEDIFTLHALLEESDDKNFTGTEFQFSGLRNEDVEQAKNLFLKFSNDELLEGTSYGDVVSKSGDFGSIYINGVKVAEEENFLFSYNITVLNAAIKKSLNRERTNVGRTAYTNSVKKILLSSKSKGVAEVLAHDLTNINLGTAHDELSWIDVQEHSVKILNNQGKYLFITSYEGMQYADMIDQAKRSGHTIITIPENLKDKIENSQDIEGNPIINFEQFVSDYNDSFEYSFINPNSLNSSERNVYNLTPKIIAIFGGKPKEVEDIRISTTMRPEIFSDSNTMGCWDERNNWIVIDRQALSSVQSYCGVLIHELIHAKTGLIDVTRDFESALTNTIGEICRQLIERKENKSSIFSWLKGS